MTTPQVRSAPRNSDVAVTTGCSGATGRPDVSSPLASGRPHQHAFMRTETGRMLPILEVLHYYRCPLTGRRLVQVLVKQGPDGRIRRVRTRHVVIVP